LKILQITLRADHGGGPQHIDLLINNISSKFDIYIASPKDIPYYQKWNTNKKVKKIFTLTHRKFEIKKLFELNKFIKNNNITIVHSHGKGAGVYSRLLKCINPKLKIIHTLHGVHIQEYNYIKAKFYIQLEKFFSLLTNKIINVSNSEQAACLKLNMYKKHKSIVILNAIDKIIPIEDAKCKINLTNKFIITTISRFDYAKNMSFAYKIAENFKNNKDIIFLWIGDGDDKSKLEEQAKKENVNIIFTGFSTKIPLYLSATDLYLSTSRWEGLPYALLEAQSLGIPIIATDVVGNNEVVIHNQNGFLFNNINESCNFINKLIEENLLYRDFSYNAKQNFRDKFDIKIMIEKTEKIYKELGK
jgi:glycosyltransferase involved in cell wall biosynthesis